MTPGRVELLQNSLATWRAEVDRLGLRAEMSDLVERDRVLASQDRARQRVEELGRELRQAEAAEEAARVFVLPPVDKGRGDAP